VRIRLIFSLINKGAVLPFHHQGIIADFINRFLPAKGEHSLLADDFTFSGLKGQTLITREGLAYTSSKVTLVFSSSNSHQVEGLIHNLFTHRREVIIGGLKLYPSNVLIEEPPQFLPSTKYVMISPIILQKDGANPLEIKKFIHPEKLNFHKLLKSSTLRRMHEANKMLAHNVSSFKFELKPDFDYLQKVKLSEKKFSRIYQTTINDEIVEIRGYTFPFTLLADEETHQFIFERGLGELTYLGYGMTDVVSNLYASRTIPYTFNSSNLQTQVVPA
jgi:CRISPR-associated endoribonuclease Cas6